MEPTARAPRPARAVSDAALDDDPRTELRLADSIETLRCKELSLHRKIRAEESASRRGLLSRQLEGISASRSRLEAQLVDLDAGAADELLSSDDEAAAERRARVAAEDLEADERSQLRQIERDREHELALQRHRRIESEREAETQRAAAGEGVLIQIDSGGLETS